jgi:phage terminase Nu1 subunit (DNA packaging protein)
MANKPKDVDTAPILRGEVLLPMSKNGELKTTGAFYKVDVIAALFNLTVRRIQQLTQEGILPTVETADGRRYELVPTIQRYTKYLSDKAYGKKTSEAESELKQEKLRAEIELKNLQGDYRQLQNDIMSGKFIEVDKVKSDYRRFFITFKKFALGIPSKLSARLGGIIDNPSEVRAIEAELNHDVITLLNGFVVAGHKEVDIVGEEGGKKKTNTKNKKI